MISLCTARICTFGYLSGLCILLTATYTHDPLSFIDCSWFLAQVFCAVALMLLLIFFAEQTNVIKQFLLQLALPILFVLAAIRIVLCYIVPSAALNHNTYVLTLCALITAILHVGCYPCVACALFRMNDAHSAHSAHSVHSTTPNDERENCCAICFNDLEMGQSMYLPCTHVFHDTCIRTWLRKSPTCPICRLHVHLVA